MIHMSTNKSNKPELRFKGFYDDWEQRKLDEISAKYKNSIVDGPFGSDLKTARKEMQRLVNGRRAECAFFERDEREADLLDKHLQLVYQALKNTKG